MINAIHPMHRHTFRGFTLIEVMVAIVIVAVLAAIGTNAYFSQIQKSRVTIAQQYLQEIAGVMERHYLDHKAYPDHLPASYQMVPPEIAKDYAPPILVVFGTTPPSFRLYLNVLPTSAMLRRFNTNLPPHTLNLAMDSDSHRWFERGACDCATGITFTTCHWDPARVNSWEDFANSLSAVPSSGDSWVLANKNYTNTSLAPVCNAY